MGRSASSPLVNISVEREAGRLSYLVNPSSFATLSPFFSPPFLTRHTQDSSVPGLWWTFRRSGSVQATRTKGSQQRPRGKGGEEVMRGRTGGEMVDLERRVLEDDGLLGGGSDGHVWV
jgi:hypothetical protein